MPQIIGQKSSVAPTALIYITLGALVSVWSGIWLVFEKNKETAAPGIPYIPAGLLLTGIAFLAIGLFLGWMAHKAHSVGLAQEAAKVEAIHQDATVPNKV